MIAALSAYSFEEFSRLFIYSVLFLDFKFFNNFSLFLADSRTHYTLNIRKQTKENKCLDWVQVSECPSFLFVRSTKTWPRYTLNECFFPRYFALRLLLRSFLRRRNTHNDVLSGVTRNHVFPIFSFTTESFAHSFFLCMCMSPLSDWPSLA